LRELLGAPSIAEAAKRTGISERTGRRWLARDDVRQRLRDLEREAWAETARLLTGAGSSAVGVLRAVAEDRTAPASARVTAARSILDLGGDLVTMADLLRRVEVLEHGG